MLSLLLLLEVVIYFASFLRSCRLCLPLFSVVSCATCVVCFDKVVLLVMTTVFYYTCDIFVAVIADIVANVGAFVARSRWLPLATKLVPHNLRRWGSTWCNMVSNYLHEMYMVQYDFALSKVTTVASFASLFEVTAEVLFFCSQSLLIFCTRLHQYLSNILIKRSCYALQVIYLSALL